jgi:branched-chain amino acid transport system permease protein
MFHQTPVKTVSILLFLAIAAVYTSFAGYFGRELVIEAAALAILVISLDLVAGYGGMVSLCHGAIFGMTVIGGYPPALALVAAVAAGGLFGFIVGAITSRTTGIFFIMATLAFGQMVYVYVFENRALGGYDGLPGISRIDLSMLGLNMNNSLQFALFAIAMVGVAYTITAFVLRSGFGRTLVGIRSNEVRMRALGLPVWRYKASAFAISGALAGFAGTIAAQQTMFVSPQMLNWVVSGEALVVVILGGLGTLVGPAIGAGIFVFLKHEVSSVTVHWHIVVGLVLIAVVVLGNRGIYGQIEHMLSRRARRPVPLSAPLGEGQSDGTLKERKTHA